MTRTQRTLALVCCAGLVISSLGNYRAAADESSGPSASLPRVFILDGKTLAANKQRLRDGDKALTAALARLEENAREALSAGPFSVVDKDFTPPSGDKHDYMSQAPYFWPNPDTEDGLPYIRRDGERNPEIHRLRNRRNLGSLINAIDTLGMAYYFTDNEQYAAKAADLLRTWFLNPETRMNPNFQFAQAIPGINTGRGIGLIETAGLTQIVDGVGLIQGSKAWTAEDQSGLQNWFSQFLGWMQESKYGRDESAAKNNHGTYYDLQVSSFAMFIGKPEIAAATLKNVGEKRIKVQVLPDGKQPLELARTKAWGYSTGNLNGLMSLARMGEHVNVDLWSFQTEDGRSIRKALDYLTPFATGDEKWPHQQLGGFTGRGLENALRRAAAKYPDGPYRAIVAKLPEGEGGSRRLLISAPLPQ